MHIVDTPEELAELVRAEPRIRVRGGGTKSGTGSDADISVAKLEGVLQYDPGEFTFTALAGTRIDQVEQLLAEKKQYLPFDPPLVEAGATLGGTVATGLSGSGRFRYGGVRDFLLGASIVTGEGQIVMTGSKVVKNAAGFDLPKLMVGSLGCFGVLTELTFKVFPQPKCFASLVFEAESVARGVEIIKSLAVSNLDLNCVDLDDKHRVWVRIAGNQESVRLRADRVLGYVEAPGIVVPEDDEATYWRECREFTWAPAEHDIVKVAITPDKIADLIARFSALSTRVCVGGHLAWIAWPAADDTQQLNRVLNELGCAGVFVTGSQQNPFLGLHQGEPFSQRLRTALDPHGKFVIA